MRLPGTVLCTIAAEKTTDTIRPSTIWVHEGVGESSDDTPENEFEIDEIVMNLASEKFTDAVGK